MKNNSENHLAYIALMNTLIEDNRQYVELYSSKVVQKYIKKKKISKAIRTFDMSMVKNYINSCITEFKLKKSGLNKVLSISKDEVQRNFFSDERIAVYTCIFGRYDTILEPQCLPNNCDFYIITDLDVPKTSAWKVYTINEADYGIENLTSAEKNRFFKMHPDVLFPDYGYSVYVDGNIKIIADPTAFVNCIGNAGIAMHKHSRRDCVYDEIVICDIYKRDTKENLAKQRELLSAEQMPQHYGMCECNVIARRHNDERVKELMAMWWDYYIQYAKRDQLSFPLVLFKNNILVSDVASLGENVATNYALRIVKHEMLQRV